MSSRTETTDETPMMDRRLFLRRAVVWGGASAAVTSGGSAYGGILEKLLSGARKDRGSLLDKVDTLLQRTTAASRGLYHGYGLAMKQLLAETEGPLPTVPKRSHAGWPHVHCVCHCNVVANLGPEDGVIASEVASIGDELNQEFFARVFWEGIYPAAWYDFVSEFGRDNYRLARQKMKYLMDYTFGEARTRRRALGLAAMRDKKSSKELKDFRALIYGLVDALESAWQRSDLHDNVLGREGGLKCPQTLSAEGKRKWCSGWCASHGVPTDVAEGPGTPRPWGPYHPLYPGPVPTLHDAVHGRSREPFDPKLTVPHPDYKPIERPVLPGMKPPTDGR